jgi:hypothetical protein
MARRHGSKQLTLQDRLSAWAEKTREQADKLEPGPARDALLKKIEQAQTATRYDALSRSSGSQPPGDPHGPSERTAVQATEGEPPSPADRDQAI